MALQSLTILGFITVESDGQCPFRVSTSDIDSGATRELQSSGSQIIKGVRSVKIILVVKAVRTTTLIGILDDAHVC